MRTAISLILVLTSSAAISASEPSNANPQLAEIPMDMIIDFTDPETSQPWSIVNDGVMGGRSSSAMRIADDGLGEFSGVLSLENNGGFASTRAAVSKNSLGDFDGLLLRVRGDGRRYQFRLRTDTDFDGVAYRQEFQTTDGQWTEITLPFAEFTASYRGRLLPERGLVKASDIRQIGFLLADKQPGRFVLQVAWIAGFRFADQLLESTNSAGEG